MPRNHFGSEGFAAFAADAADMADAFGDMADRAERALDDELEAINETIAERTERNAPRGEDRPWDDDHVHLKDSVRTERRGTLDYRTIVDAPHAAPVEYGTSSYQINARNQEYLHFQVNGQWVRTPSVTHPGIDEARYARNALDETRAELPDRMRDVLRELRREFRRL